MRYPYPKNWILMSNEEKKKWMQDNGQKIADDYKSAHDQFLEEIKRKRYDK